MGHGTAAVLRAPGEPCWIFDAGSRDRRFLGSQALGPLLAAWEVRRPAVVLSHEDRDHRSALDWLVERFPPRLWAGALTGPLRARLPPDCPVLDLPRGRLELARRDGLRLELGRGRDAPGNEGSRSLAVECGDARLVLCGDAEAEGLYDLLAEGFLQGPLELLLFPHHGSDTRALAPLLASAQPKRVWVSASSEPQLAREFRRRGLAWSWTGRDGPLSLQLGLGEIARTDRSETVR